MKLKDYLYFKNKYGKVYKGNCVKVMRKMKSNSVDTIITDPPYGLEFMGKKWDKLWDKRASKPNKEGQKWSNKARIMPTYQAGIEAQQWHYKWAKEVLRVAKPGAFMFVFGGTRTYHRLACGIEDAGWEIRDCMSYNYGSGFPKSLDISKAIDKKAGVEREVVGHSTNKIHLENLGNAGYKDEFDITAPATPEAQTWEGYSTALKPAWEPILLCMKPIKGNFAENALKHGVAGLNIDGGRIGIKKIKTIGTWKNRKKSTYSPAKEDYEGEEHTGRWPSNFILQHHPDCELLSTKKIKGQKAGTGGGFKTGKYSGNIGEGEYTKDKFESRADKEGNETIEDWNCHPDCPIRILDEQSGVLKSGSLLKHHKQSGGIPPIGTFKIRDRTGEKEFLGDTGGASRFFYCAKASGKEKHSGLYEYKLKDDASNRLRKHVKKISKNLRISKNQFKKISSKLKKYFDKVGINNHPTVKPLGILQYLCNLTKMPKNNVVLDMFGGSGTTAIACLMTGRKFIIIEKSKNYCRITKRRLKKEIKRLDVKKIEQIKLF